MPRKKKTQQQAGGLQQEDVKPKLPVKRASVNVDPRAAVEEAAEVAEESEFFLRSTLPRPSETLIFLL